MLSLRVVGVFLLLTFVLFERVLRLLPLCPRLLLLLQMMGVMVVPPIQQGHLLLAQLPCLRVIAPHPCHSCIVSYLVFIKCLLLLVLYREVARAK